MRQHELIRLPLSAYLFTVTLGLIYPDALFEMWIVYRIAGALPRECSHSTV